MDALLDKTLDQLAADVKAACFKACAKVPSILRISNPENDYQRGYNAACTEIAERIAKLEGAQ